MLLRGGGGCLQIICGKLACLCLPMNKLPFLLPLVDLIRIYMESKVNKMVVFWFQF